MNLDPG